MTNPTIRVTSYAPAYRGWLRCPTDQPLPGTAGNTSQGLPWVDAGPAGRDRRYVDLQVDVRDGIHQIELTGDGPAPGIVPTLPDWTRGEIAPTICGVRAMPWPGGCRQRGAAWEAHLVAQVRPNLWAHLVVWHYSDRRGWLEGRFWWQCGNAMVDALTADVPLLTTMDWGGIVHVISTEPGGLAIPPRIADGQHIGFPVVLFWPEQANLADMQGIGVVAKCEVSAYGLRRLWSTGNPRMPAGQKALPWMREKSAEVLRTAGTMSPLSIGPAPRSGSTGAQADQVFVGAEIAAEDGGGAEVIYQLAAYRTGCRPCAHVEFTGELLRLDRHPNLRLWDGRPHWHAGVSPDRLGKTSSLTDEQTAGWWGPDVEHPFHNLLYVASRSRFDPLLQWQLGALARVYLLQWTAAPGLSTSQPYAARAIGWECLLVRQLDEVLEDRSLAADVLLRWMDRWSFVVRPHLEANPTYADVRRDDPRLGAGEWWIPWQQSVMAYGLWMRGLHRSRQLAVEYARVVFDQCWIRDPDGGWSSAPVAPVGVLADEPADLSKARAHIHEDAGIPMPETDAPPQLFDRSFNLFGMPLAVAVLKMAEPTNERAQRCWSWLVAQAGGGHPWLPPEAL